MIYDISPADAQNLSFLSDDNLDLDDGVIAVNHNGIYHIYRLTIYDDEIFGKIPDFTIHEEIEVIAKRLSLIEKLMEHRYPDATKLILINTGRIDRTKEYLLNLGILCYAKLANPNRLQSIEGMVEN